MQEWNKKLEYLLLTDFNIDKAVHVQLFLMAKYGVLNEYLLKLVQEDMQQKNSCILDPSLCNKIILKEMGYLIEEDNRYLSELRAKVDELTELKNKREERFSIEKQNVISQKFENRDVKTQIEIEKVENIQQVEKLVEVKPEQKSNLQDIYKDIDLSPTEENALSNLTGNLSTFEK